MYDRKNGLLIVVLLVVFSLSLLVGAGIARSNELVHMNGNDIDCCVRYTIDTNSELEGYFFADIKVALPFKAPSVGLKWNHELTNEDVMGLPFYK